MTLCCSAQEHRRTGAAILTQQTYRFYDYEQMGDFEIFEGSLDKELFESGRYVVAVALDGEGDSYYHVGDKVNLYEEFPEDSGSHLRQVENGRYSYYDNLRKREYEVLAVVGDEYRNRMARGNRHIQDLDFILPTKSMEQMSKTPELFMVTMNAPDAVVLDAVEPLVKDCLDKMGGEDVVSYRSKGVYRRMVEEFGMVILMIGNGLAVMVGMMALVNFLNSCVSGIAERKEEFSTLLAIGMTKSQLLRVLKLENLYMVLLAVVPGYLLGQLVSAAAIPQVAAKISYIVWDMSLLPGIILAVVMAALSMIWPNRGTILGGRADE
ncbi:MAG: ABC transporter permease [Clostridium sp.]|nr:ABC transporter permease [Acetatifactor muris]MCM1526327.1 ABC transporter permease [Bacteroides sp.]MCM1562856.1 ABC transporter permease [Clostridium sp.]